MKSNKYRRLKKSNYKIRKRMSKRMFRGGKSKRIGKARKRKSKKNALKGGMFGRFSKKTVPSPVPVPVPVITREKTAISIYDFCLNDLDSDTSDEEDLSEITI